MPRKTSKLLARNKNPLISKLAKNKEAIVDRNLRPFDGRKGEEKDRLYQLIWYLRRIGTDQHIARRLAEVVMQPEPFKEAEAVMFYPAWVELAVVGYAAQAIAEAAPTAPALAQAWPRWQVDIAALSSTDGTAAAVAVAPAVALAIARAEAVVTHPAPGSRYAR